MFIITKWWKPGKSGCLIEESNFYSPSPTPPKNVYVYKVGGKNAIMTHNFGLDSKVLEFFS